ncbi:hypothetical protein [Lacinutrix sp.]|uniref:hypothetical protein n=1 Tax=Lacinutrix sp. TaxID=1937692 RepID=UPI00260DBC65|nr:hypothetical protein [Lacinutrix sp.]MDG1714821.1 hypothetical protein [Lacinutrix sp.]
MNFFKKLFGGGQTPTKTTNQPTQTRTTTQEKPQPTSPPMNISDGVPEIVTKYRVTYKGQSLRKLNDLYFDIMGQLTAAEKKGDVNNLLMHCQGSLGLLESLIKYNKKEYGSFDIKTIPALDKALIYFAINGNTGQLKNIQDIVDYFKELHPYKEEVDVAFARRDLAARIYQYVKANPNCLQTDLKKNIDCDDGRFISTTVQYMEKAGKLTKKKEGTKIFLTIK